jgi:hypothetical protein
MTPPPVVCTEVTQFHAALESAINLQLATGNEPMRFSGSRRDLFGAFQDAMVVLGKQQGGLYYTHTVHAVAFMMKGQWAAALQLAGVALAVADRLDAESHAKGREAGLVAALAARRMALTRTQLDVAARFLRLSRESDEPEVIAADPRFALMEASLNCRRLYFAWFVESRVTDDEFLRNVMADLEMVLDGNALDRMSDDTNEEVRYAASWVEVEAATDWISLAMCGEVLFGLDRKGTTQWRTYLERLEKGLLENVGRYPVSIQAIDTFANAIVGLARAADGASSGEAVDIIQDQLRSLRNRPYDPKRTATLLKWAADHGVQ